MVVHWLDTPFLSPQPHPQTATMSGWSMGAWVQCVLYGVTMARLVDSGVRVAGGKKGLLCLITLLLSELM